MNFGNINTTLQPFKPTIDKVRSGLTLRNIVIGVIIVVVLYYLYQYFFGSHKTSYLVSMHEANKSLDIPISSLPSTDSNNYTISLWMNVNDFNYAYGEKKNILFRQLSSSKDATEDGCPDIYLDATTNAITCSIPYGSADSPTMFTCTVNDIPLQDWFCYIMTINQNTLDIYINGKLVKTCVLPSTTIVNHKSPITLNHKYSSGKSTGFSGYLSNIKYSSFSINPDQAFDIYQQGYSGSMFGSFFDKYKVKFAFVEDNKEIRSIQI